MTLFEFIAVIAERYGVAIAIGFTAILLFALILRNSSIIDIETQRVENETRKRMDRIAQDTLAELNVARSAHHAEMTALRNKYEEVLSQLFKLQEDNTALRSELNARVEADEVNREQIEMLKRTIRDLREELDQVKRLRDQEQAVVENLSQQLTRLLEENKKLLDEIKNRDGEITRLERRVQQLENDKQRLEQRIQELESHT